MPSFFTTSSTQKTYFPTQNPFVDEVVKNKFPLQPLSNETVLENLTASKVATLADENSFRQSFVYVEQAHIAPFYLYRGVVLSKKNLTKMTSSMNTLNFAYAKSKKFDKYSTYVSCEHNTAQCYAGLMNNSKEKQVIFIYPPNTIDVNLIRIEKNKNNVIAKYYMYDDQHPFLLADYKQVKNKPLEKIWEDDSTGVTYALLKSN